MPGPNGEPFTEPTTLYPSTGAVARRNSIPNPSFSADALGAAPALTNVGWDANWSSTLGQVQSGWSAFGDRSLRITGTHNGTTTPGWMFVNFNMGGPNQMRAVVPGRAYSFSCYLNILNAADDLLAIGFNFWDDAVPTGQFSGTGANFNGATGLQRLTVTGVVPAGKFYVQPLLMMWTDVASDVVDFYADGFLWEDTPAVGTYFDGSLPGAAWDGAANASTSHTYPTTRRTNVVTNPNFETDAAGWGSWGTATLARSTGASVAGAASLRVTGAGTANGVHWNNGGIANWARAVPGEVWTASCFFKADDVGDTMELYVAYFNAAGTQIAATGTGLVTTGGWQRISDTLAAPAGTAYVLPVLVDNSTGPNAWYMDNVLLEKDATAQPYFDGSSPGCWWDGTANASSSGGPVGGVRRNLASNPSYETSVADLQQVQATGSLSRVASAEAQFGGYVARQVCPGTNGAEGFHAGNSAWATLPGRAYTATARIKATAGKNISLRLWDSGATDGGFATTGDWQIVSTTRTAPDVSMFYAFITAFPQVVTFDVDWVIVEEGSSYGGAYADGSLAGMAWDGTAHASQSHSGVLVVQGDTGERELELYAPAGGRSVSARDADVLMGTGRFQLSP